MARFNHEQADNYGNNGAAGFFQLKNDKDTAMVRFMYNTIEDVEGFAVHEVEVEDKKRYVNCLREYNDPIEMCPLCAAKYKVLVKLFVQVYDMDTEEMKIWDRGKTFMSKLSSLCARYNPLVSTPFEIERNGKAGSTKTTYETYAMETDDITLDELPELQELLGTLILDKNVEELEFFLDNGFFEETEEEQANNQTQRNPAKDRNNSSTPQGGSRRQTPANAGGQATRRTPANNTPNRTPSAPTRTPNKAAADKTTTPPKRPAGRANSGKPQDKF